MSDPPKQSAAWHNSLIVWLLILKRISFKETQVFQVNAAAAAGSSWYRASSSAVQTRIQAYGKLSYMIAM